MATSDEPTEPAREGLPEPVVADLVADERRRCALAVLSDRKGPVAVDDLAAAVCARENTTDPDAVPTDRRRRVREEFFQDHLPKLTATDVVAYDSTLGTVELTAGETLRDALGAE